MKWIKKFDKLHNGWAIKSNDANRTPVVFLPEPLGGLKDLEGFNVYNEKTARLIETAPELLSALKDCRKALASITILNTTLFVGIADKVIKKAEG